MTPLNTLLIGFGRISAGHGADPKTRQHYQWITHAEVLTAHSGFHLAGVVDPDPEARRLAKDLLSGLNVFDSIAAVEDVYPAIVLATPPTARLEVLEALKGVSIALIEKPVAMTTRERAGVTRWARRNNATVAVNYFRRADALTRRLAAGELERLIGRPMKAFATYTGGLRNNGAHMIDLLALLLGPVTAAAAFSDATPSGDAWPDYRIDGGLIVANGARASLVSLDGAEYRENGVDVWGAEGRIILRGDGLECRVYRTQPNRALTDALEIENDAGGIALAPTVGDALYAVYDDLLDAHSAGRRPACALESAVATEAVVEALILSAQTNGARITLGAAA